MSKLSKVDQIRAFGDVIRPRWSVEILTALTHGPHRWTDLARRLTVSSGQTVHSRTLTETLRHLQNSGIIDHPVPRDDSATYRLTRKGHDLLRVLDDVADWAARHSQASGR